MHFEFSIEAGDFENAGRVSSEIKKILKELNINAKIVRKTVVALYESEVNVVGHSYGGNLYVNISSEKIHILVKDEGPGIPDIELAMSEGFSTADEEIREMGFGAGMGLPNIRKNTDYLDIRSEEGAYTEVEMEIRLTEENT
ncbi:MAG: ATP-binding protein [Sediminispirochaetaceae bacterium]